MLKPEVNHALGLDPYPQSPMETMGSRIKTLRKSRNLSQEELGRVVGVSGASISQWESGDTKNIRPENFLRMTAYFSADPYWVVFGDDGDPRSASGKFRRPPLPSR